MYYAQLSEDSKLCALLHHEHHQVPKSGFYIDIGAWEPQLDSVTKHFYDTGWRGINVEPIPYYHQLLVNARPHDINLQIAVGDTIENREFTHIQGTGLSTFHQEHAKNGSNNRTVERFDVPVLTLARLCEIYVPKGTEIEFLKIDVEGWEEQVLRGADFMRYRPKIVVIEATIPGTETPVFDQWEHLILREDYTKINFDGLNCWYRANEFAGV